jgi:hypothetical protein
MLYAEHKIDIFTPFRLLRSTLFHKIFFLKFALCAHRFCAMRLAPKKCYAKLQWRSTPNFSNFCLCKQNKFANSKTASTDIFM